MGGALTAHTGQRQSALGNVDLAIRYFGAKVVAFRAVTAGAVDLDSTGQCGGDHCAIGQTDAHVRIGAAAGNAAQAEVAAVAGDPPHIGDNAEIVAATAAAVAIQNQGAAVAGYLRLI